MDPDFIRDMEKKVEYYRARGMSVIERRFLSQKETGKPTSRPEKTPDLGFFCLEFFKDSEIWTSIGLTPPERFVEARIRHNKLGTWNGIKVIVPVPGEWDGTWVEGYWCEEESEVYNLGEKQLGRGNFGVKAVAYEVKVDGEWLESPVLNIARMIYWQGNRDLLEQASERSK